MNVKHKEHQVAEGKQRQYDIMLNTPGALMAQCGQYVNFLLCGLYLAACTPEAQEVHYYCSVQVFTIEFHPSAYFASLDKIDCIPQQKKNKKKTKRLLYNPARVISVAVSIQ